MVDFDQKLADWANNEVGNDYTSVLIKRGEYYINNTTTNKKDIFILKDTHTSMIAFEIGAKIIATDNVRVANQYNYIFNFNSDVSIDGEYELPSIYNANVEFTSAGVGITFSNNCINYNCRCILKSNNPTNFFGVTGFQGDKSMAFNCYAETQNDYARKYLGRFSKKFVNCHSSTMVIEDSYCVRDCICLRYNSSYSSPTADPAYACANTLEGG